VKTKLFLSLLVLVFGGLEASQCSAQESSRVAGAAETLHPGDLNRQVSRAYIFVDKKGFGHQHAVEGKLKSGNLRVGVAEAAGQLVFDMQSFDADTPEARRYIGLEGTTDSATRTKVNQNMRGSHVLDVAHYPTAVFDVDSATATGHTSSDGLPVYELCGDFTLHGTRRPVKVLAAVEQSRGWLHLRGKFGIHQSSYGITPYSAALGAIGVADPLVIYGDLWVAPTDSIAMATIPERK
jgi:polyisoprenoid-binding protein YceI